MGVFGDLGSGVDGGVDCKEGYGEKVSVLCYEGGGGGFREVSGVDAGCGARECTCFDEYVVEHCEIEVLLISGSVGSLVG